METPVEFMGKPIPYWVELQNRAESLKYDELIEKIARLNVMIEDIHRRVAQYMELTKRVPGATLGGRIQYLVNLYELTREEAGQ